MDIPDLTKISDPFLRDWAIIIVAMLVMMFAAGRWLLGHFSTVNEKTKQSKDTEVGKLEKFLYEEIVRCREEIKVVSEQYRRMSEENHTLVKDTNALKSQLRRLNARRQYLEQQLHANSINFTPYVENLDYE